jgi:hypothetical protein
MDQPLHQMAVLWVDLPNYLFNWRDHTFADAAAIAKTAKDVCFGPES